MTDYYPEAFFDGRFFFDGSLEGALLRYTGKYWCMEGAVDNIWIYPHLKVASVHHYDEYGWGWQQVDTAGGESQRFPVPGQVKGGQSALS